MDAYTPRPDPMYPGKITDENIRAVFEGAGDFIARKLRCGGFTLYAYAIDGLTSGGDTSEYVFRPLSDNLKGGTMEILYKNAMDGSVYNSVADPCLDLDSVAMKLVNGFCVVLFPDVGAIAFEVKTGEKRGPSAPEVENTVKGAKDAFVETVRSNTSLVRRHLRTPDLRFCETKVGRRSLTNVSIVYIEGLTNLDYVRRMQERIDSIDVEGLLSDASVEEYVTGSRATAFPLLQFTERTDRFCQGLLAGRVGLFVDGLPQGYLAPVDLGTLMESQEDWSKDYVTASCIRVLRYCALALSLFLPALYIAMATFHQEMIPLPLLRAIIESKRSIPFSTVAEVFALLLAFELLQESGIQLPQAIGQSVSIIGGIVVGTAAVDANLVSPAALIVVSIAGVSGFALPNRDFADGVRVWRFALAVLAAIGGLFAVTVGLLGLLMHLASLESLGVPYLAPLSDGHANLMRRRMVTDKYRDRIFRPKDMRRQK